MTEEEKELMKDALDVIKTSSMCVSNGGAVRLALNYLESLVKEGK